MALNLKQVRFLVVDDNEHIRKLVRVILRSIGADMVEDATDGKDAIAKIEQSVPDIVLCDWEMEPMDGLEFTRYIRRSPNSPNSFLPVIMMTGLADRERVLAARDAGANEFVIKPLSAQTLHSRIASILENPRCFVRSPQFFGPDRRRQQKQWQGQERRDLSKADRSHLPQMNQRDINGLFKS